MRFAIASFSAAAIVAVACSSSESSTPAPTPTSDASADVEASDAAVDSPASDKDTSTLDACTPCKISLEITLSGMSRAFDRVQYGFDDAAKTIFYLEGYAAGDPECPGPKTATPDRTLIMANVKKGAKTTYADGARVTYLDFKEELTKEPAVKATDVTFTPASCCVAPGQIAFTVDAKLPNGNVKGTFVADHCDSLDTMP